jgi:hypothetical protein
MHEIACPACNQPAQHDIRDYLFTCRFCSVTFRLDLQTGQKELYSDHYIVPNTLDGLAVKGLVIEWLKRLHHKPSQVEREYFVVDIKGYSLPYWVVSLEAHTAWKGLIQKRRRQHALDSGPGSSFLFEEDNFRRSYRWAISARKNICEFWGLTRLHEPRENLGIDWDGFPLDSTFSRGRLQDDADDRSAYDMREFFDIKYTNGLPLMGIQVSEEEALRRARTHVDTYHQRLAALNVDYLVDFRTELEVAGVQLIHLPFWFATYQYRPRTALKHFYPSPPKNLIIDGLGRGVLKGELAMVHRDKVFVNAIVCAAAAVLFFLLGAAWHPAFFLISIFALAIGGASAWVSASRSGRKTDSVEGADQSRGDAAGAGKTASAHT